MTTIKNTSYRVHVQDTNQAEVDSVNIENGAMLRTDDALYMGHNGENVIVYPQSSKTQGLGWTRYDDNQYTVSNKLTASDGVKITLPNNGANIYRSQDGIDYYNPNTNKIIGDNLNDLYSMTIVFKISAANANQTFVHLNLENIDGTPYERVRQDIYFPKGNDVQHDFHHVFQYYIDSDFISNGAEWEIISEGGDSKIWDIIFFIAKTQNAG